MKPARKFKILSISLTAIFAAWFFFLREPQHPSVTVPGDVVFRYEETTHFTDSRPSQHFPALYSHSRWTHPSPLWKPFNLLPTFLQFGVRAPSATRLGSISDCVSDQAIWFSVKGEPKDRWKKVRLTDDNGYEAESEWTDYHGQNLVVPGVGPRCSKRLTVRFFDDSRRERPVEKITLQNPLKPAGPPFAEIDRLPASRTIGNFTVTLKSVLREKVVSSDHAGLHITWEITKNGVARKGWQLVDGSLADGSGNFCLLRVKDSSQLSCCKSALFSDDPIWKFKLTFRRQDGNTEDYEPVVHVADLPMPAFGDSVVVNKTFAFPRWEGAIESISRRQQGRGFPLMTVRVRMPNFTEMERLIVVRSDAPLWNNGTGCGPYSNELTLPDPSVRGGFHQAGSWSLDLGVDSPIRAEFQCRVQFAP